MFSTSEQGNCLRFFELQSVSANAMRIFLDKMPDTFQKKIEQYCKSHRIDSEEKKDFVSRMYAFFYFNIIQYFFNLGFLYWNKKYL